MLFHPLLFAFVAPHGGTNVVVYHLHHHAPFSTVVTMRETVEHTVAARAVRADVGDVSEAADDIRGKDAPIPRLEVTKARSHQANDETIDMCRSMFSRFSKGQEMLRRNHGVPVLNQQAVLDQFINYLNVQCRVPAEVTEMLQRMRSGSCMNNAGGTSGGRLRMTEACLCKEPAFVESVCDAFFRGGTSTHFELFPSTTKSIEAFVSLLAHEASLIERPIRLILPSDAHYCWSAHPAGPSEIDLSLSGGA